jgi:hypothetical protein
VLGPRPGLPPGNQGALFLSTLFPNRRPGPSTKDWSRAVFHCRLRGVNNAYPDYPIPLLSVYCLSINDEEIPILLTNIHQVSKI